MLVEKDIVMSLTRIVQRYFVQTRVVVTTDRKQSGRHNWKRKSSSRKTPNIWGHLAHNAWPRGSLDTEFGS